MCGICGTVAVSRPLPLDVRTAIGPMTARLAHRGPDGQGLFFNQHAALGHRRLAIIDVAAGQQPMTNEDGTCHVVFNGEIYNHRSLREYLQGRGHRFQTASDTEVILHGYEEWGPDCVQRFEGMFAFALYDHRLQEALLARDRLGKKPLFYAVFDHVLHFASELKAIAASPAWQGQVDDSTFEEYLSLGYILAPRTIYRNVFKLEPGQWLRFSRAGLQRRQYWDVPSFDHDQRRADALIADLDGLLGERVAERLESEVPLGAFLSGGIDSGLIVSYMAHGAASPVRTTSVGFDAAEHNELAAARATALHHGTAHNEAVVSVELDATLDRIVDSFDEPFADASAVPTYYVSQIARRQVTVALSGDGGDEVFGGYDFRYVPHALESYLRPVCQTPAPNRLVRWASAQWPAGQRLPRPLRLKALLANVASDPATAYYRDLCFLKPERARALLGLRPEHGDSHAAAAIIDVYNACPSPHVLQKAQYADLKIYLPNDPLVKVDRMSMAHGLEVRSPLLDRRVVEFGFGVPPSAKMPRLQPKFLLKRLARTRLPAAILNLPKRGFTAPVGEWIGRTHAAQFREEVLGREAHVRMWLDMQQLRRHFDDHQAGRADHAFELWAVWMLERWSRGTAAHASVAPTGPTAAAV